MNKNEIKVTNWPSRITYNHTYFCQLRMLGVFDKHVTFEISSDYYETLNIAIKDSALAFTPSKDVPEDAYITIHARVEGKIVASKTIRFKIYKPNKKRTALGFALGLGIAAITAGTAAGLICAFPTKTADRILADAKHITYNSSFYNSNK